MSFAVGYPLFLFGFVLFDFLLFCFLFFLFHLFCCCCVLFCLFVCFVFVFFRFALIFFLLSVVDLFDLFVCLSFESIWSVGRLWLLGGERHLSLVLLLSGSFLFRCCCFFPVHLTPCYSCKSFCCPFVPCVANMIRAKPLKRQVPLATMVLLPKLTLSLTSTSPKTAMPR